MKPENNDMDKKLRQLENQSLPDLSSQDAHWEQMKTMLQPGAGSSTIRTAGSNKFRWWIIAAFIIGGISLVTFQLTYRGNNKKPATEINIQPGKNIVPADTLPVTRIANGKDTVIFKKNNIKTPSPVKFLRARTTDGKDILVPVISVNDNVPVATTDTKASLDKFFMQLEKQPQQFTINNNSDTIINGEEGTVLLVPAHTFEGKGEIVITMKEFYSYEDIITNQLTTRSNAKLLITGGMLHLTATRDGNEVAMQPGKSIRWFIPDTSSEMKQMQLFTGNLTNQQTKYQNKEGYLNPSNDTLRVGENLETINWIPSEQFFITSYLATKVKVLDLKNDPYKTRNTRKGSIAKFHIAENPKISPEQLESDLKDKYGYYKVKIKNRKKDNFFRKITPVFLKRVHWESFEDVGDSVWLGTDVAQMYKLKASDTLTSTITSISYVGGTYVKKSFANVNLNNLAKRFSVDIRMMGWINCDRFYNDDRPKMNYYVDLKDTAANYYTVLVFDKIKAMTRGITDGNKVMFPGVPKGESARIICVGIQNGKTVAAMETLPTSGSVVNNLKFEETNPVAFREDAKLMDK